MLLKDPKYLPKMTDVHFLRYVWRRKINDNSFSLATWWKYSIHKYMSERLACILAENKQQTLQNKESIQAK